MDSSPLLTVCLITYNHVNYVRTAIDGVLMQRTDFDWNLIIADDFSTDGTREILLEYQASFPDRIQLILQPRNIGAARNWLELMNTSKSRYIAYFEGDDYWTDYRKLQKQVDFLEKRHDCVLCFHPYQTLAENGSLSSLLPREGLRKDRSDHEVVRGATMHTSTVVFRKSYDRLPEITLEAMNGDIFLYALLVATGGSAGFIPDIGPSVYRIHKNGVHTSSSNFKRVRNNLKTLEVLYSCLPSKYDSVLSYKMTTLLYHQFKLSMREKSVREFWFACRKSFQMLCQFRIRIFKPSNY